MTGNNRYYQRSSARLNCLVTLGIGFAVLIFAGLQWHQTLLEQVANVWSVSDPIERSDAVVILGGGIYDRSKAAADLYRKGLTKKILISDVVDSSHAIVGGHYSDTALSREALLRYGIPNTAIETFGTGNQSTQQEAAALRDWSDRNSASSFIIPAEFLFSRRVRWIFNHEFSNRNVKIAVYSLEAERYTHEDWWKHKEGVRAFKSELLKLVYYHVRY